MFDVDRTFAHDRMKKAKNNNKIENDYRVYWSPGVKWPLPTCVMSGKGEWNKSIYSPVMARTNPWRNIKILLIVISFET